MIYLLVIIALFAAIFFVNQQSKKANDSADNPYGISKSKLNPETIKILNDPNYQNLILPDELDRRLSNKESFFQYFYSSTCPHCRATTPILIPIEKELGLNVTQFNLQEFATGWKNYNIQSTPTIVYYKNGKEVDRLVGGYSAEVGKGYSADDFKNFYKKHMNP